ncbi:hypothetical protein OT109_08665 [Phycisphaeraceae bacterium D3-23]
MHWLVPFFVLLFILYVVLVVFGLLVFPMFRNRVHWLCYPVTLWLLAMAGGVVYIIFESIALKMMPTEPDWGPMSLPMLAALAFVLLYGPLGVLSFTLAFGIKYLFTPSQKPPAPLHLITNAPPPTPAPTTPAPGQAQHIPPRSPAKKRGIEVALLTILLCILGACVIVLILGMIAGMLFSRG